MQWQERSSEAPWGGGLKGEGPSCTLSCCSTWKASGIQKPGTAEAQTSHQAKANVYAVMPAAAIFAATCSAVFLLATTVCNSVLRRPACS